MLGELRNIGTQTLVGMALAIFDTERPLSTEEMTELEQIQRELRRRRYVGRRCVRPIAAEEHAAADEQCELVGGKSRREMER